MANAKIVLRKEKKQDGTYPLAIRITKDRKSSYVYLNYSIDPDHWSEVDQWIKRSCPSYKRLNNFLLAKLAEANDTALELESGKRHVTSKVVTQKINPRGTASFMGQAKIFLENLEKSKKFNRWTNDRSYISHFKNFLPGGDIAFAEITPTLLKQFAAYLKDTRNVSERSIMNNMVVIRCVINQAIASHITDIKYYPFGKGKFKIKIPDTLKIGLTVQEVKMLEDADLSDPRMNHARNLFLFCFYFAGIRLSDAFQLQWSDFMDGRLYYLMDKNYKGDSLKVPERAVKIMEQYRRENPKHDLVFPDLEAVDDFTDEWAVKKRIKSRIHRINEYLDMVKDEINKDGVKLNKKLDPHISRHTFGNISGKKIPLKTLQKLYRHTHLSTTANYQQNFTHEEMDDALDKVLGAV
jgi:integrase/recombinase XerD